MEYKAIVSDDITELILDDHATFRRLFARLDEPMSDEEIRELWFTLGPLLSAHAIAEEQAFYPPLLKAASDADDVKDMIKDHNEIRDAVHAADRCEAGSKEWRDHVAAAREANSKHMAEEERETLPAARKHISMEERVHLGLAFLRIRNAYPSGSLRDLDRDKDPERYVERNRQD